MSVRTISPNQLGDLVKSGQSVHLIDVRTPLEFREVHATCAKGMFIAKMPWNQISTCSAPVTRTESL